MMRKSQKQNTLAGKYKHLFSSFQPLVSHMQAFPSGSRLVRGGEELNIPCLVECIRGLQKISQCERKAPRLVKDQVCFGRLKEGTGCQSV